MGLRCPCKFRLGIEGNEAPAEVGIFIPEGTDEGRNGTINFSAVECFTEAAQCNQTVDNFEITFVDDSGNTVNFTQGKRGVISCIDGTTATLTGGTAQVSGNVYPSQGFTVDFSYTIDPSTNVAIIVIHARGTTGATFDTTFTAPISTSPQTFIGDCTDTVGP